MAASSSYGLRAFGQSRLEISADSIQLFGGNQRTHIGGIVLTGSNLDLLRLLRHSVHYFVENAVLDIQTRACAAALPVIKEDSAGGPGNRCVEINVGENNVGRLTAQFERNFFSGCRQRPAK